ncbi:hypothetical protein MMC30_008646 [Trapelia coarctata]|nr:hypothetical protein [Trapelia coarctata]
MTLAPAKVVPLTCHGHTRPINHLSFSSMVQDDQFYMLSACKDQNPMIRDGLTGDWIGTFLGHKGAVWQSRLSADSTFAVTGAADFTAKLWNTYSGECLQTFQHNHIVRAVALPPTTIPQLMATGSHDRKLQIFDISHYSALGSAASPTDEATAGSSATDGSYEIGAGVHSGALRSVIWGPDFNIIISATEDSVIRWWDLRQRTPITSATLQGALGTCELNISPTASIINKPVISIAAGKTAYFFDANAPGTLLNKVETPHEIASVALQPDEEKFVVGGSKDTYVRVYNLQGEELELQKGHHGPVWTTNFSPNGKLYATGSEDGTIKLWKFCQEPYGLWK